MVCFDLIQDEVRYSLVGPAEVLPFFYINPLTGLITITKPLTGTSEKQYNVSNPEDLLSVQ